MIQYISTTQIQDDNLQPFCGIACGVGLHVVSGVVLPILKGKNLSIILPIVDVEDPMSVPRPPFISGLLTH